MFEKLSGKFRCLPSFRFKLQEMLFCLCQISFQHLFICSGYDISTLSFSSMSEVIPNYYQSSTECLDFMSFLDETFHYNAYD